MQRSSYWLTDQTDIFSHYDSWLRLADCNNHRIFSSPEWFQAALTWQPKDSMPIFWVLKENDKILGIMPLIKVQKKLRGITHTSLEWLKVPDTQFCDIIARPQDKPFVLTQFFKDLNKSPMVWDTLDLYPFPDEWIGLIKALPTSFRCQIETPSVHYWVSLKGTWNDYYKTRSRRLKKGNNHLANRLETKGKISIKHITDTQHYSIEDILSFITYLSGSSWKDSTQTTFNYEAPKQFIESLTQKAIEHGWLSLWLLTLNEEPIAFEYQLQHQGNVYALRSDFNEKYRDLSPGSYLNWKVLEQLFKQDLHHYYMGPGSNAYKTRWQDQCDKLHRVKCYANTLKSKWLYSMNEAIIPRIKTVANHFAKKENIA